MPQLGYSQKQYEIDFHSDEKKRVKALERALDTRKFEIELYWKRATYFWSFIGAAFAGFIAVHASSSANKHDLVIVLSCVGFVFSVGWLCVNRGSKHWQENWEKHVDMLEDGISGPLYKVILTRGKPEGWREHGEHIVTGSSPLSVSKINQLISLYVSLLWTVLVWYSLPQFSWETPVNWFYCTIILLSLVASATFFWLGRTYPGGFWHRATIRTTEIKNRSHTPGELARLGAAAFDRHVRPVLRAEDDGKFVAIDVETGEYEINEDDYAAVTSLRTRRPAAEIWLERVGQPTAYQMRRCQ